MPKPFLPKEPGLYWAHLFDGEDTELVLLRVKLYPNAGVEDGFIVDYVEQPDWHFEVQSLANDVIVSPHKKIQREFFGVGSEAQPQVKIRWQGPLRKPSYKDPEFTL